MRSLPPELLRTFIACCEAGSFTGAAERVHLSQSTVSQHVRRLEDLLDRPLFERDTRSVRLSPSGHALKLYASRILTLMDEAVGQVCGPPLQGLIKLGLAEDFAVHRLTNALADFVMRNPGVELNVSTGLSGDLFAAFDRGEHDVVLAKRLQGNPRGQLIRTEPLRWCGSTEHPALLDLDPLPIVIHPEPSVSRQRMIEVLEGAGRRFRVSLESSSLAVLRSAILAGVGVGAFGEYVMPEGTQQIDSGLPELGDLEYVVCRGVSSDSVEALVFTLTSAATAL